MLKYQVRTLGRSSDKRRQTSCTSIPIKDVFNVIGGNNNGASSNVDQQHQSVNSSVELECPGSPWHGNNHLRRRGRSTSVSSLSSTSTSSESSFEWGPIRVYTSTVRSDTTYYTFFVSTATTAEELIQMTVTRLRMLRPKDIQLFYLTMELDTKHETNDVHNVLVLDSSAKPLELQACHPKEKSKFVLMARQSYPVKIYDYCLSNTSNYKSLLICQRTTCEDAIKLILQMHKMSNYSTDNFVLVLMDGRSEQILHPSESLANVCQQIDNHQQIHIKPLAHILKSVRTLDAVTFAKLTSQFGDFVL